MVAKTTTAAKKEKKLVKLKAINLADVVSV
jgi:hypothetical protein